MTNSQCENIWVPFTDEKDEGVFLNMNDDSQTELLFWDNAQPNGLDYQNYVALSSPRYLYNDVTGWEAGSCTSCLLDRSMLLQLDGLCDESDIGEATP